MCVERRVYACCSQVVRIFLLLKRGCVGLIDHASEDFEHELVGVQLGSRCTTTKERLVTVSALRARDLPQ